MANLTESPIYEPGIFQLEKSTPPLGGAPVIDNGVPSAGHANAQAAQLANRTSFLKVQVDDLDSRVDVIEAEIAIGGSAVTLASDLANETDPFKGATLIGYDNTTISQQLNNDRKITDFAALRLYTGPATGFEITSRGISGKFYVDTSDTSSADNNGTIIVDGNGRRIKRLYTGAVCVSWFGASTGVGDAKAQIQAAVDYAVSISGAIVSFDSGTYYLSGRITNGAYVTLVGKGRGLTVLKLNTGVKDRVLVLNDYSQARGITCDASNNQAEEDSSGSVGMVRSFCRVEEMEYKNGYTGVVFNGSGSTGLDLVIHDNLSRGLQIDPSGHDNNVTLLKSYNNAHSGIALGHGAYDNTITNFSIWGINGTGSIYIAQGGHDNVVTSGTIRDPLNPDGVAINIEIAAYKNRVSDINLSGYCRAVQFVGGVVDASGVPQNDTWGNVVSNITGEGLGSAYTVGYAITFQQQGAVGTPTSRDNIIHDCVFNNYYGIARRLGDAVQGCVIRNIKQTNTGAGGIMKAMKAPAGSGYSVSVSNVQGFKTRGSWVGTPFDITTTGTKSSTILHGVSEYIPPARYFNVALIRVTAVADFRIDHQWVVATSATDFVARAQVGAVSATSGSTQNIAISFDMQAESGFDLTLIT